MKKKILVILIATMTVLSACSYDFGAGNSEGGQKEESGQEQQGQEEGSGQDSGTDESEETEEEPIRIPAGKVNSGNCALQLRKAFTC